MQGLQVNLNIYNLEPAGALNQTGEEKYRIPALNYVGLVDEINLSHWVCFVKGFCAEIIGYSIANFPIHLL